MKLRRALACLLLLGCGSSSKVRIDDHEIHQTVTAGRTEIYGKGVDLAKLPPSDSMPLPVMGTADIDIDIKTPLTKGVRDYSHANGHIVLHCDACRIGDDRTKLPFPGGASGRAVSFAGQELYFGHVDLGRIDIRVTIDDGKAAVQDFTVESTDVEIKVVATAELASPIGDSRVEACIRFKDTAALAARDPKTDALIQTTGAPLGKDGFFNIKVTDRFSSMKRLGVVCDGTAQDTPQDTAQDTAPQLPDHDPTATPDTAPPPPDTTPPPAPPDSALEAAMAKGITKKSDTSFEVDQDVMEKFIANPIAINKGARIVPAMKLGKPDGFKVYAIRAGSFYDRIGLVNGDTLQTVAGVSIVSAEHALDAYTKVHDTKVGESIKVEITRRGKPLTLSYTLR